MWRFTLFYFSLLAAILFCNVFSLILFALTLIASLIFGIVIYLDEKLPYVEKDYELFRENKPIHFIERDPYWDHMTHAIDRGIQLVDRFDFNRRFIDHCEVDTKLNQVLELIFHNHIYSWYQSISPNNHHFPHKLYSFLNYTISAFAKRLKEVNISNLITTTFIDELTKHTRLYRLTKSKLGYKIYTNDEFVTTFFSHERKLEKNFSREKICLDKESFLNFLSPICDILQYILFPYNSFNVEFFKIFTKQLLLKIVLFPFFDTLSEPDFINGLIVSLFKSSVPSTEIFISVLQSAEDVDELRAVLESVEEEIIFVRSKDQDDNEHGMKQQLNSLLFLKTIVQSHLKKFINNDDSKSVNEECSQEEDKQWEGARDITISFDTILRHNDALEYFIEYMSSINAVHYINFYINVQSFRISVEQGMFEVYLNSVADNDNNELQAQLEQLVHDTALNIYDTYLSEHGPSKLTLIDSNLCNNLYQVISSSDSSQWMKDSLFDDIFYRVRNLILKHPDFFPSFKRSKYYHKLLTESDLIDTVSNVTDRSIDELSSNMESSDFEELDNKLEPNSYCDDLKDFTKSDLDKLNHDSQERKSLSGFDINIVETGIINEHGKTFIGYIINIEKKTGDKWMVLRRYSEFFNFHQLMLNKCDKFHFNLKSILFLPPKSVLTNRMNVNFIRYRKYMLNLYLKKLNYLHDKFTFLREDIEKFLQPGNYRDTNHSKNVMFNPIKTIGNVMKNQSENLLDGFQKLSRTLSLQPDPNRNADKKSSLRFSSLGDNRQNADTLNYFDYMSGKSDEETFFENKANCQDLESEENIPLLQLLDEVFELKSQNFWLRRRIIDLFKQFVEVAYNDTINKKIVDYVDEWTSPASISSYIDSFKNQFYPNGLLAQSVPRKKEDILRRKVAAKALILTYLSDLKRVVGNETLQTGLLSFFELFQHKTLNLRLVIVLFELLMKEIFPNNYFDEIFTRLYLSLDPKSTEPEVKPDWPPYLSKFVARS